MESKGVSKLSIWLITGATGTFGKEALNQILSMDSHARVRCLSRDEVKQSVMQRSIKPEDKNRVIFMLGDVREPERLRRAMDGADYVLHAAALKRIEKVQSDVRESFLTNCLGSLNVAEISHQSGVISSVLISSDKACSPINTYGVTKLMAEHLFQNTGNSYGGSRTTLNAVRYGNVWGSTGSLIEYIKSAKANNSKIEISSLNATRFFFSIKCAVKLAIWAALCGNNGSIYVPKLKSANLATIIEAADVDFRLTGIKANEKLHECLISECEMERSSSFYLKNIDLEVWEIPKQTNDPMDFSQGIDYHSGMSEKISAEIIERAFVDDSTTF